MSAIDIIKDLIKDYKFKMSTRKYGILGFCIGTEIQFDEKITQELFATIVNRFNTEFGAPIYMHSYYGVMWYYGGEYISCNIIEEIYGSDFLDVFLFNKIPLGQKLPYKDYNSIDSVIKQVFCEFGFNCDTLVNYNRDGLFPYIVLNEKTQWLLHLKGKNMTCYFSDVKIIDAKTKQVTPRYWCKKTVNFKNLETIRNAMKQSFSEYENAAKV